jgi:uncharacterized protein YceK
MHNILLRFPIVLFAVMLCGCVSHVMNTDPNKNNQQNYNTTHFHCVQESSLLVSPFSNMSDNQSATYIINCMRTHGWQNDPNWKQDGNSIQN